jgi:transcriptional regulator with XRE-family HTH domain
LEQSAYGKYELGQRQPSLGVLQRLSNYFGVTTDYLLGNTDDLTPSSATTSSRAEILADATI